MDEILLFSGGLDSLIAWFYLNKPTCLYVSLGHRYNHLELKSINTLMEKFNLRIDLKIENRLFMGDLETPSAFIPLRNHFLISLASLYAPHIYCIVQKGEMDLSDRSMKFFKEISKELSTLHEKPIKVETPFEKMTKQDLLCWFLNTNKINLDKQTRIDIIKTSRSCYSSTEKECGECSACFRKWISLESNGVHARDWFEKDPAMWVGIKTYIEKMGRNEYDPERTLQTINVLRQFDLVKDHESHSDH